MYYRLFQGIESFYINLIHVLQIIPRHFHQTMHCITDCIFGEPLVSNMIVGYFK